jgi:phage terminase large subunit-like protein
MNHVTRQWIQNAADDKAAAGGCYFDLDAADRVRQFFATFLRHSKGAFAGKPVELLDWQWRHLIGPAYGWKRADGSRRFRFVSAWVAKKNGKSTIAAAIVLNALVNDDEAGAEVYGAAADRFQAKTVFNEAATMVEQSPSLARRLDVKESTNRIVYSETHSAYWLLSKDSKKTGHGKNASAVIIDEVHVCDRRLYAALRYAGSARRQPLFFEISTAGDDPTSFGYDRYLYAKRVANGEREDLALLPYIAEADSNDVWDQEEQWRKANPSLGSTISLESFRDDFQTAANGSVLDKTEFCQLRLNVWQKASSPWMPVPRWDQAPPWPASAPRPGFYPLGVEHLLGRTCYGGMDLSKTLDLTCLALLFPETFQLEPLENGEPRYGHDLLLFTWTTEVYCRERERLNKEKLDRWIGEGWIRQTAGDGDDINYDYPRACLRIVRELFELRIIAFDRWNATKFELKLRDEDGVNVEEFPQTIGCFTGPMKEVEKYILGGRLRHGGNPVARWMLGNTVAKKDVNENIRPDKGKSRDKIDGIVATIMAVGEYLKDPLGAPSITFM